VSTKINFSVIVPTYNRAAQLAQCLQELVSQQLAAWEIIVVDDGSAQSVRAQLESQFPQVRWLEQANQGPAAARNRAARISTGDYLAFTDDDCLPDRQWLACLAEAAQRYPGAVLGGTTVVAEGAGIYDRVAQLVHHCVYQFYNANREQAFFLASNNLALPRSLFEELQGFDEGKFPYVSEDRDLCARVRSREIRLVWQASARVLHLPKLNLYRYCKMYFRYGRGAARYHQACAGRGAASHMVDGSFHLRAPGILWQGIREEKPLHQIPCLCLCILWQICNAAGFFWERMSPWTR
jgi:GT2 family glycosyltransferase